MKYIITRKAFFLLPKCYSLYLAIYYIDLTNNVQAVYLYGFATISKTVKLSDISMCKMLYILHSTEKLAINNI